MKTLKGLMIVGMMTVAASAFAQSPQSATGTVQATVTGQCRIITPFAINFGAYDAFTNETTDLDADGTITYRCTNGVTGAALFVDDATQTMSNGATGTLNYALYTTAARTNEFPSSDGTTFGMGVSGTGSSGMANSYTASVFGRVAQGQDPEAGTYNDNVTIYLNW